MKANVRANRAPAAGRQARTGENVPRTAYRQTGPGGLPLALRLSEGLGIDVQRCIPSRIYGALESNLERRVTCNYVFNIEIIDAY